ncbi:hypothetical protein YB2330_003605 [Saitoella coloradoensis]
MGAMISAVPLDWVPQLQLPSRERVWSGLLAAKAYAWDQCMKFGHWLDEQTQEPPRPKKKRRADREERKRSPKVKIQKEPPRSGDEPRPSQRRRKSILKPKPKEMDASKHLRMRSDAPSPPSTGFLKPRDLPPPEPFHVPHSTTRFQKSIPDLKAKLATALTVSVQPAKPPPPPSPKVSRSPYGPTPAPRITKFAETLEMMSPSPKKKAEKSNVWDAKTVEVIEIDDETPTSTPVKRNTTKMESGGLFTPTPKAKAPAPKQPIPRDEPDNDSLQELLELLKQVRSEEGHYEYDKYREAKAKREADLAKMREEKARGGYRPTGKPTPLTSDILEKVNELLRDAGDRPNHVFAEKNNIPIKGRDLQTLLPRNWLNDEIINFYIALLNERSRSLGIKVHIFNTFFLTSFEKKGYASVRRWAKKAKVKIDDMDLVVVPVNVANTHWWLATINLAHKRLECWDSISTNPGHYFSLIRSYLQSECPGLDTSTWTEYADEQRPMQSNGSDCGVFTCLFAEVLSRGARFDFGGRGREMEGVRRRMVAEIMGWVELPVEVADGGPKARL